ncbi:acyl-CoA thioester hydrolase/BAAT C-terminal domain-containing protein [uncultured Erythrobacter sp.]|uniref:alpha/beta hydrolase n=1 Tax=uncultured Erythrobacter sp. TaxID=263913 RepID=UPI002627BF1E|nr:acyl-CoA thioester hydrolase/BAAT C-terminal domain-containing protein [uncultured Erythrobacter sp.]
MKTPAKVGIGCLVIVVAIVGFGAWSFFNREPRAIIVAKAGDGGERVMLGDVPANFYPGAGEGQRPALLMLGGSEGGLKDYRNELARQLAAEGYSVLYPGYFETREDNRPFNMVPIETFDNALAWLASRADIDAERIGVLGHSKGAEGALVVASRHPEIAAVVAAMPSDVVWEGFDLFSLSTPVESSWAANGEPLPYVAYITPAWYEWISGGQGTLAKMYKTSWDARGEYPDAEIPVEQIDAPIFMVCGEQDTIWHGCDMARSIEARAPNAQLLGYDNAGHWAFGVPTGLTEKDRDSLGKIGGTAEGDLAARKDQWPKMLAFLTEALNPEPEQ